MQKLFALLLFVLLAPTVLLFSISYFFFISHQKATVSTGVSFFQHPPKNVAFAALPTTQSVFEGRITIVDGRIEAVRQFLASYNSPLAEVADTIIAMADKYNVDYRIVPAIAMQESGGCRKIIANSNNCWGFGIYGKKVTTFGSFAEGIETLTKYLAKNHWGSTDTLDNLASIYNPNTSEGWRGHVQFFINQL